MATIHKNLSTLDLNNTPNGSGMRIAVIVSEWNENITQNLAKGAIETLQELGVSESDIAQFDAPGTYELSLGSQLLLESSPWDAVIAIGSVIRGETAHFDFVCQSVAQGVKDVSLKYNTPVIFCVLTDDTLAQAEARSGGQHGNKGVEAAVAAVKMAALKRSIGKNS